MKLFIADRTRGTSFSKQLDVAQVDVSSAEWIVEAPSACGDNGGCRALPLADFGTTSFASVRATSATGHTGTISDPAWSAVAITLSTRARGLRFTTDQGSGTATPADLSPAGDAFAVTYQAAQDARPGRRPRPDGIGREEDGGSAWRPTTTPGAPPTLPVPVAAANHAKELLPPMPITVGDTVPPIQAPTYLRGRRNARLMGPVDHLGRWVVLVFYPRDFTFVCPTELAELADLTPAFMDEEAAVMAVSTDSWFTHRRWFEDDPMLADVLYPVLADTAHELVAGLRRPRARRHLPARDVRHRPRGHRPPRDDQRRVGRPLGRRDAARRPRAAHRRAVPGELAARPAVPARGLRGHGRRSRPGHRGNAVS